MRELKIKVVLTGKETANELNNIAAAQERLTKATKAAADVRRANANEISNLRVERERLKLVEQSERLEQRRAKAAEQAAKSRANAEDKYAKQALADMRRLERERQTIVASSNRAIANLDKQLANERTKEFKRGLSEIEKQLGQTRTVGKGSFEDIASGIPLISRALNPLTLAVGSLAASFGFAVKSASNIENLQRQMRAVTNDTALADRQFRQLVKDAQELEGVQSLESLVQGVNQLTAAGLGFEKSRRLVEGMTNALTNLGKTESDIQGVILALTQISATDFLQGDELRQLQERLPFIRQLLTEAFGTSRTEDLKKLGLTSNQVLSAIQNYLDKQPQAVATLTSSWNKFYLQLQLLGATAGQPLLSPLTFATQALTENLRVLTGITEDAYNGLTNLFTDEQARKAEEQKKLAVQYGTELEKNLVAQQKLKEETSLWGRITKNANSLIIPQIGALLYVYRNYKDAVNETTKAVGRLSDEEFKTLQQRRLLFGNIVSTATGGRISPFAFLGERPSIPAIKPIEDFGKGLDEAFDLMSKHLNQYPQLKKEIDSLVLSLSDLELAQKRANEAFGESKTVLDLQGNFQKLTEADRRLYNTLGNILTKQAQFDIAGLQDDPVKQQERKSKLEQDLKQLYTNALERQDAFVKTYKNKIKDFSDEVIKLEKERVELTLQAVDAGADLALAALGKSESDKLELYQKETRSYLDAITGRYKQEEVIVKKSQTQLAVNQEKFLEENFKLQRTALETRLKESFKAFYGETPKDGLTGIGLIFGQLREQVETSISSGLKIDSETLSRYNTLAQIYAAIAKLALTEKEARKAISQELERATRPRIVGENLAPGEGNIEARIRNLRAYLSDSVYLNEQSRITATERERDALEEILALKLEIAASPYTDSLRVEAGYLRNILDLRDRESDALVSIHRSRLELAQQTVYSATQANARVLDFLASQRSVTDVIADFKINIVDSTFGAIDRGLDKVTAKLGIVGNILKDLLSGLIRIALNRAFGLLFGGGQSGASQQTSGGGGGFLGFLRGIFGGGLFGRTPPFAPSGGNNFAGSLAGGFTNTFTQAARNIGIGGITAPESIGAHLPADILPTIRRADPVGAVAGAAAGSFSFARFLGGIAPGLGASFGSLLGGQSLGGNILGSIGGLAAGAIPLTFLSTTALGGIFGTTGIGGAIGGFLASSAAIPVLAPIAAALLIGSYLLGKKKQRKADETQRDKFFTDAISQMRSILADVSAIPERMDGEEGKSRATQIFQEWTNQVNQIKTKSVRNSAIQNQRPVLLSLQNQINAAAEAQSARKGLADKLTPEFAGGFYIPGAFDGRDDILAYLSRGEMVLNPMQQQKVKRMVGFDPFAFADIPNYKPTKGMPRFETGGVISDFPPASISSKQDIHITQVYEIRISEQEFTDIVLKAAESDEGKRVTYKVIKKGQKEGEI